MSTHAPGGRDDRDEPDRDPWLREALRHAPDADAAPPPALRDAILRQARDAAARDDMLRRARARAAAISPWAAAWAWLARPPVAAGFASVMVATLVGMMWWDRPMDEALPRSSAPPTKVAEAAPPDRTRAAPAPAPPVTASAKAVPEAADKPTPTRSPPAPPMPIVVPAPAQAPAPAPAPTQSPAPAPKPAPMPFTDERKQAAPETPEVRAPVDASKAAEPAAPPAPPAPAAPAAPVAPGLPAPAVGALSEDADKARRRDTAPNAATDGAAMPARALSKSTPPAAAPAPTPAPAPAIADRLAPQRVGSTAGAVRAESPLRASLASLTTEPGRWAWSRVGSTQPMTPAVQRWLVQLEAMSAARWRPAAPAAAQDAGSVLRLYRDGSLQATLRIDTAGVSIEPAATSANPARADLPPATLAQLTQALADAAP